MRFKKIIWQFKALLLILIILLGYLSAHAKNEKIPITSTELDVAQSEEIAIRINDKAIINNNFYGFGAETLPWLWTQENKEVGINKGDIELNLQRIVDLQLPITRIFLPWETWNPSIDYKTFEWESDEMKSLYKMLDVYQKTGTKVILVTVDWLKDPPWRNTEASSQAVVSLLEYLINDKGYNCIEFWTLTNEPELTYGWLKKLPFENYVKIHQLVKKGIEESGILVKIVASDDVESEEWFKSSVQSLSGIADIFSSHAYFYPQNIHIIPDFFRERSEFIKASSSTNKIAPFFLCEFGFRGDDFGACINSLIDDYAYGLYVANLCIEVLNSGVDAASLWCLHEIRLIDEINPEGGKMMRIGLWGYKDKDWRPYPIFYLYRLFTRYIKSQSSVLEVDVLPSDTLKAACVEYNGNRSLFIVNMSSKKHNFSIEGLTSKTEFKKYVYSSELNFANLQENLLEAERKIKIYEKFRDEILPLSVVLYTSEEE
jgi:hypothetical protein